MKKELLFGLLVCCIVSCTTATTTQQEQVLEDGTIVLDMKEDSISSPRYICEIPLPKGYERVVYKDSTSFGYFLQHLPIKPIGTPVYCYDGSISSLTDMSYAVIDGYDTGNTDLQQCADWIIRLRAEWLYSQKRYDDIAFHFTNGWLCEYKRWAEGERVSVKGNHTSWYKATTSDYSYKTFRKYLDLVFNYAGTLSLSKELVKHSGVQIGNVFIEGGSPGHAMIIVDWAKNTNLNSGSRTLFMVAEGYMPAQDFHIVLNTNSYPFRGTPWFDFDQLQRESAGGYNFPTYGFQYNSIKRFNN